MFDLDGLLKTIGLNQKQLAALVWVTPSAVTNVRNGKMSFPHEWASKIKKQYNVNTSDFEIPDIVIEPETKYAEILMAFSEWQGVTLKKKVKVQGMRSDRIYLNLEELEKIRAVKLPTQSLDNIRDIFLFMAWTGLRYSDVAKFDESFIQGQTLVFFSQKTGSKSVIPIFPIVGQILSKGLPRRPSGQKFNDILKEVCKYAGLTELIQLTKLEGERKIPYSLPKYEAVTAHTGRRSFVTNMSVMGLTAKQISLMTGHSQ